MNTVLVSSPNSIPTTPSTNASSGSHRSVQITKMNQKQMQVSLSSNREKEEALKEVYLSIHLYYLLLLKQISSNTVSLLIPFSYSSPLLSSIQRIQSLSRSLERNKKDKLLAQQIQGKIQRTQAQLQSLRGTEREIETRLKLQTDRKKMSTF